MRKKRKLTKFGKGVLIFIILIITTLLFILINKGLNDYNELANKCDLTKGYTCSLYEIQNFND